MSYEHATVVLHHFHDQTTTFFVEHRSFQSTKGAYVEGKQESRPYFILDNSPISKLKVNKRNDTKPGGIDPSLSVRPSLAESKMENPRTVSRVFAGCVPCAQSCFRFCGAGLDPLCPHWRLRTEGRRCRDHCCKRRARRRFRH